MTDEVTFDANDYKLSFVLPEAVESGTYNFINANNISVDTDTNITIDNNIIYDIDFDQLTGDVEVSMKSIDNIVDNIDVPISSNDKETMSAFIKPDTGRTEIANKISIEILTSLQNGHSEKAVQILRDVAPDTTQSTQVVAQTTANKVANIVSNHIGIYRDHIMHDHITPAGRSSGDSFDGTIWAQAMYNYTKKDAESFDSGFKSDTTGVVIGVDTEITNNLLVGLGYAYTKTDIDSGTRNIDVDGHTLLLFSEYSPSAWYVNSLLSFTLNKYDEEKYPAGIKVKSNYDSNTYALNVMVGYDFYTGLSPEFGLRYLYTDQDSYNDGIQRINPDSNDILTGVLGIKYTSNIQLCECARLRPIWKLALTYDFISDNSITNVTVIGNNNYTYQLKGERLKRFAIEAGIGLATSFNDWDFTAEYDTIFRDGIYSYTGILNAKYHF